MATKTLVELLFRGIISPALIIIGAIDSYFSFERGIGIMFLGIFIIALTVYIYSDEEDN